MSYIPGENPIPRVEAAAERGLQRAMEFLLTEANRTAPIEEGTLERSGVASVDGLEGAVSYNTPYAVRQHEETGWSHDAGRRAKWLELTVAEQASRVGRIISEAVKEGTS